MRQLLSLLLIAFVFAADAAETWRWKDESGVVHYSDRPVPGAERVDVQPRAQPGDSSTAASTSGAVIAPVAPQAPTTVPYTSCVVTEPANDAVFNAVSSVSASLQIQPALQAGHRVQVMLNGQVYTAWADGQSSHVFTNPYRGSYTLSVRVLDAAGRPLCSGAPVTFHVRQPSLLAPGRIPNRRP
jgi:Domain of unknown function (DUF4124)